MNALARSRFAVAIDPRQGRIVLEALGARPYREVHALIGRVDGWSRLAAAPSGGTAPLVLEGAELLLVVQALAELPYRRVHGLIGSLRDQLAGLQAAGGEAA